MNAGQILLAFTEFTIREQTSRRAAFRNAFSPRLGDGGQQASDPTFHHEGTPTCGDSNRSKVSKATCIYPWPAGKRSHLCSAKYIQHVVENPLKALNCMQKFTICLQNSWELSFSMRILSVNPCEFCPIFSCGHTPYCCRETISISSSAVAHENNIQVITAIEISFPYKLPILWKDTNNCCSPVCLPLLYWSFHCHTIDISWYDTSASLLLLCSHSSDSAFLKYVSSSKISIRYINFAWSSSPQNSYSYSLKRSPSKYILPVYSAYSIGSCFCSISSSSVLQVFSKKAEYVRCSPDLFGMYTRDVSDVRTRMNPSSDIIPCAIMKLHHLESSNASPSFFPVNPWH